MQTLFCYFSLFYHYLTRPSSLLTSFFVSIIPLTAWAQSVTSARIDNGSSDRLTVTLDQPITVSDARGFRLVGGVARIDRLLSGSGSNTLVFDLTDHALPDDEFKLLHWPEMSDARSSSGKLGSIERAVANDVNSYNGSGTLYYISTSGSDNNGGTSNSAPLKTVEAAQTKASPGDFILLKRGDIWDRTNVVITKSGTADNYLTIGAYGSGDKPIVYSKGLSLNYQGYRVKGATFAVHGADYVQIDNLHIKTDLSVGGGGSDDGIQLLDCKYAIVSNCIAEASGPGGYFGIRVNTWVYDNEDFNNNGRYEDEYALFNNTYPQVLNSEVFGYFANMGTQIGNTHYRGSHKILEGGLIENCISRDPREGGAWENIMINRGEFNGFVIRKNDVYGFRSNGIEAYGAKDVIIEYNEVHDPASFDRGGRAIKAGGYNSASQTAQGTGELFSENIIVRYNKVYNITQGGANLNGIDTNNGLSGQIYGNVVYNVGKAGIIISFIKPPSEDGWDVYNNTVLNAAIDGIQVYKSGSNGNHIRIKNNILQGSGRDINVIDGSGSQKVIGANNILINNRSGGAYQSTTDLQANLASLFVNPSQNDYRLKEGAPAIDAGTTNIPPYERDIRGFLVDNTPDIGAYEFGDQFGPVDPNNPDPNQGIYYAYYEGDWSQLPDFNSLTPIKTGTLPNFSLSPAEQDDYYGFVQAAFLDITQAGGYTFYLNSDDGAKLYIDGSLVVDNDGRHSLRERSGTISLSPGEHRLRVEYFEAFSSQALEVRYAGPGINKQFIPSSALRPDDGTTEPTEESGVRYSYYEGDWTQLPNFDNLTPIKTGVLLNFTLSPAEQEDYYGFQYTTYIEVATAGSYTFYTNSDDGSKLYVNNQLVVDNDGLRPPVEKSGSIDLSAGRHKLVVDYFEGYGGQSLEVSYAGPGISKQLIPDEVLFLEDDGTDPPSNPVVKANAGPDRTVSVNVSQPYQIRGGAEGPNPFRRFLWEKVSGPSLTLNGNSANAKLSNLRVGTYVLRFTATDSEGNSGSDEMTLTVTGSNARLANGTKEPLESKGALRASELRVYPNPVSDRLEVYFNSNTVAPVTLDLIDLSGRVVYQHQEIRAKGRHMIAVPVTNLPKGMYLLRWQQGTEQQVHKILIER